MKTIPTLTLSAMKMFVRNRQALFFTLFMPTIIMTIFGLIGFDKVPKIDVGIVSTAPSAATQQFIDQLKKIDAFTIKTGTEAEERTALKKGSRAVVFIIPNDFFPTAAAKPAGPQTLTVLENVAQTQSAKTAETIMTQILDKTTLGIVKAPSLFTIKTEAVSVRQSKYIDFLLPGIVGLAIMQMAVFSVAFVFTDYKEKGILKRLLATPMKPFQFVTANVITRLLVALVQTAILMAIGVWLFHSHVYGSLLLILLISTLGAIMFLGLGFTISGIAGTVESVPAIANLVVFPMLFLGGTFFPLSTMPVWLQHIVKYLPLQYFTDALREVMANGSGISVIAHDLYWMMGWAVVMIALANFTFGFEEKRL